jgi:hypothetical protein
VVPFFFLPETANRDIPESIEDMKRLSDYSMAAKCCRRRKRKVSPSAADPPGTVSAASTTTL